MSTDTDYIITIKGKDAALRKAAADYIELLLQPWGPQRDDKKTLTRMNVFRNESNARGLLAPSSLCEDAAKLFPGTDVSFESKNEYGNTEEGQWNEDGDAPKDANGTLALKALERIKLEVKQIDRQVAWLTPLAKWAAANKAPRKFLEQIKEALNEAKTDKKKLADKATIEKRLKIEVKTKNALALEAATRWSFHPVLVTKNRRIGTLGKPRIWKWAGSRSKGSWSPCESKVVEECIAEAIRQRCASVCIGFPFSPDSSEGQNFLETQTYDAIKEESPYIFLQTPGRFRGLGLGIHKYKDTFHALLSPEDTDQSQLNLPIKEQLQLSSTLENSGVFQILDEKAVSRDKDRGVFNTEIRSDCMACQGSHVFLATDNSSREDNPAGRIYCLSQADGKIVWSSEYRFHVCVNFIVLDSSKVIALVGTGGSPFLVCLDAATGVEQWRKPFQKDIGPSFRLAGSGDTALLLSYSKSPVRLGAPGSSSYTYETQSARLFWIKLSTGEVFLEKTLPKEDWPEPELALDGKRIYVAGKTWITALTHDGTEVWKVYLPKADRCQVVLTGTGKALLSRGDGGVTCVNCETGATVWNSQDHKIWGALVGGNDTAFLTGDNCCMARNANDGSLLWHKILNNESGRFYETPVLVNEKVFVIHKYDILKWFDVTSGTDIGEVCFDAKSDIFPSQNGAWVAVENVWLGSRGAGTQVVCLNSKVSPPKGPWPMKYQGEGRASFLPDS
jgi:outer membrane protein assembly factor BamB